MNSTNDISSLTKKSIVFMSFHDIDMQEGAIRDKSEVLSDDVKDYVISKIDYIMEKSKNSKIFKLDDKNKSTYDKVVESIDNITNKELLNANAEILTNKLIAVQNKKTSEGALLQAIIKDGNNFYYTFIKNEFEDVIERERMSKTDAFIYGDKAPLKTCLFKIGFYPENEADEKYIPYNIFVDDSQTSPFALFWYSDFLHLIPKINDDISNVNFLDTSRKIFKSFDIEELIDLNEPIEGIAEDNFKKKTSHVRFELENHIKGYMTINNMFRLDEYLKTLEGKNLGFKLINLDSIKDKFYEKSEDDNNGFSKVFSIDKKILNQAKYKVSYRPRKNIQLSITGRVDNNLVYLKNERGQMIVHIVLDSTNEANFEEITSQLKIIKE